MQTMHNRTMTFSRLVFCLTVLAVLSVGRVQASSPPQCADFLRQAGFRHVALKYTGCSPGRSAQIRVLRATYEVSGRNAATVEAVLIKRYGMAKLKFNCCLWEPKGGKQGWFKGSRGYGSSVSMGSGETVYSKRSDWPKINIFLVTVELALELP
jgi:hypothetical protein